MKKRTWFELMWFLIKNGWRVNTVMVGSYVNIKAIENSKKAKLLIGTFDGGQESKPLEAAFVVDNYFKFTPDETV